MTANLALFNFMIENDCFFNSELHMLHFLIILLCWLGRLENEHLNNVGKFRAFKSVPLPFTYREAEDNHDN